jgi:hypothetical protein
LGIVQGTCAGRLQGGLANLAHDKVGEAVLHRPGESLVGPDILCDAELLVRLPCGLHGAHASGSSCLWGYPNGGGRHFSSSSSENRVRGKADVQLQEQECCGRKAPNRVQTQSSCRGRRILSANGLERARTPLRRARTARAVRGQGGTLCEKLALWRAGGVRQGSRAPEQRDQKFGSFADLSRRGRGPGRGEEIGFCSTRQRSLRR